MATIARSAWGATSVTSLRTRRSVLGVPARHGATYSAPSRSVAMRFKTDDKDVEADRAGAQHTGFKKGHESLHDDKLSTTVAGGYEWQIFYLVLAGTVLFFPLFPGITQIAQSIYEGIGGKLN